MLVHISSVGQTDLLTIAASIKVNNVADTNVDDSEEALILLLEFLLIKYLNGENTVFTRSPSRLSVTDLPSH